MTPDAPVKQCHIYTKTIFAIYDWAYAVVVCLKFEAGQLLALAAHGLMTPLAALELIGCPWTHWLADLSLHCDHVSKHFEPVIWLHSSLLSCG